MHGADVRQLGMFSYVSVEGRVPTDPPPQTTHDRGCDSEGARRGVGCALCDRRRESIPPERLLRASLLHVIYSVRSERLLMEQLNDNLWFRGLVGRNRDDPVWDHSAFPFNRERLCDAKIAQHFVEHTVLLARLRTWSVRALSGGRHTAGSVGFAQKLSPEGR